MKSLKLAIYTCFLFPVQIILAQNYDESKVNAFVLPEILKMQDGTEIKTVAEWERKRSPEILQLFEDNIYGQMPKEFDKITFLVENENKSALDGKATLRQVAITVSRNQKSLTIHLIMFVPNKPRRKAPVFLVINHRGIRTMDVTRTRKDGFFPVEEVIDAGYAIAGFDVKDVAPDNKLTFTKGVFELYPEQLTMDNGMGALGAWAWGASRVLDYLEKDKTIDSKKVMVVGHSRGGKAALWCGAQDKRVAVAISNDSGESGAALSKRNYGETIKDIVRTFPYWFCKNYSKYIDQEKNLPVDQHQLLALMAPRGVYVANASEDLWADPLGQYQALLNAQPAFKLYGIETNLPKDMPGINEQIIAPKIGFHNREGKHNMTPYDWKQFIVFANNYFESATQKPEFKKK